jgi:glycerol-3-phosphate dehydrogenase
MPKKGTDVTSALSRNHVIEVSDSGLVSLMGGKWTSYRRMGVETVDKILNINPGIFEPKYEESQTLRYKLFGSYSKVEVEHGIR